MPNHGLCYEKHALQIDVEDGVEVLLGHVPKLSSFFEARVVNEDVDLTKGSDGFLNESLPVGNFSNVGLKSRCAPLSCFYSGYNFVRAYFVFPVANSDVSAFARQALRYRASNPLIATRYGGDLPYEPI
jgi:hypothetical protein